MLRDRNHRARVSMQVGKDDLAAVRVCDTGEKDRATMWVKPDGSPFLALMNQDGAPVFRAPK